MIVGRFLLVCLLPILLACSTQPEKKIQMENTMSIAVIEEHGFVNVTFELFDVKVVKAEDGSTVYGFYFGGVYKGKSVYAALALSSEWDANQASSPIPIFGSEIGVYAIAEDSHNLVSVLRAAYGMEPDPSARLTETINARVLSIGEKPTGINSKRSDLKAFFSPPHHELYGELYINIDPEKKRVEFNEKDPDYRKSVIRAFTAKPKS
jgi:ribose 5-phosphate isomerase RpiB